MMLNLELTKGSCSLVCTTFSLRPPVLVFVVIIPLWVEAGREEEEEAGTCIGGTNGR